jgi:hypothetical protein
MALHLIKSSTLNLSAGAQHSSSISIQLLLVPRRIQDDWFKPLLSTIQQKPNARINRARIQRRYGQVSRMKAMLFALRLNELLGASSE